MRRRARRAAEAAQVATAVADLLRGPVARGELCVIGEATSDGELQIVGAGISPCLGLRKGALVDPEQTVQAIEAAVEEVAASARRLIHGLVTNAEPKSREIEAAKARARSAERFGGGPG